MGRTQVFEWFSTFKTSVSPVEDAEHSGCQLTSKTGENMDQVKDFVLKNSIMNISRQQRVELGNITDSNNSSKWEVIKCGVPQRLDSQPLVLPFLHK
jgi:hypothetical protein